MLPPRTSSTKLLLAKKAALVAVPVTKALKTKAAIVKTAVKLPVELFKSKVNTVSKVIREGK